MKVLFVVNTFPSFSETFIRDQVVQLINNGIDVRILSYNGFDEDKSEALINSLKINFRGRTISYKFFLEYSKFRRICYVVKRIAFAIRKPYLKFLLKSLNLFKYGSKSKNLSLFYLVHYIFINDINIIHAHFGTNGNEMSVLKQLGIPIKLVTTFHGYDIRLGYAKGKTLYDSLKIYGDVFISISAYNRMSLLEFGFEEKKIIDLPNGVDINFFKRKLLQKTFNRGNLKILTVGRLVPEKNIELAIKAFKKIVSIFNDINFEYHIIGDGVERNRLEQLVIDLKIDKLVFFHGIKRTKEVRDLMIKSDIFVLSSSEEAFPTVILEAKSCGLPIVATDVGSVKDMLSQSGIIVKSNSLFALTEGIETLIINRKKWPIMARENREEVEKNYDIKQLSLELIKIYRA